MHLRIRAPRHSMLTMCVSNSIGPVLFVAAAIAFDQKLNSSVQSAPSCVRIQLTSRQSRPSRLSFQQSLYNNQPINSVTAQLHAAAFSEDTLFWPDVGLPQ